MTFTPTQNPFLYWGDDGRLYQIRYELLEMAEWNAEPFDGEFCDVRELTARIHGGLEAAICKMSCGGQVPATIISEKLACNYLLVISTLKKNGLTLRQRRGASNLAARLREVIFRDGGFSDDAKKVASDMVGLGIGTHVINTIVARYRLRAAK